MAGGSGKLCSSLTHEPLTDAFGTVYKVWVKDTSINPIGREKVTSTMLIMYVQMFI